MTIPNATSKPEMERYEQLAFFVGLVGLLASVAGFFINREQFFQAYLFGYLFWFGVGVGCLGLLMLNHVVGGKWGIVIRRLLEVGSANLPMMFVFILPILFGLASLYIWARPEIVAHDEVLHKKAGYLNVPFFLARTVLYFVLFSLYVYILTRLSAEQDRTGNPNLIIRMRQISAPGLIVLVLCATFAFVDWVMSLEPHWYSTIYGLMFLVGQVLQALAFVTAVLILFSKHKPLDEFLTTQHFHDLGNLVLAFTVLWAYLSFSQFLIIWAGNLPEETPWYLNRLRGGWNVVAVILILFHFAVPFVILLYREAKRRAKILLWICFAMLAIRIVDVFWVVEPGLRPAGFSLSWMDFATFLGVGGIWVAMFFRRLKSRPILPFNDPRLVGAPKAMVTY